MGVSPPQKLGELIIYLGDTSKHELDEQNTGFTWIYDLAGGNPRFANSIPSDN